MDLQNNQTLNFMDNKLIAEQIESRFRQTVRKDAKVKNAYLFVHSAKCGIQLNLAESGADLDAVHPDQPHYMASVGKLFTATIAAILHEKGELSFDHAIARYLDGELMHRLHIFRGTEYSSLITIRHLLQQSSGLADVFWPLLKELRKNPRSMTTRDAIIWGKSNLEAAEIPGVRHVYTDTNYYLLGLIVERVTGKPFHEVLHELIFDPLEMKHACMQGFSKPVAPSGHATAQYNIDGFDPSTLESFPQIDYAGGGVVATSEEYVTFLQALTRNRLIGEKTLDSMVDDNLRMGFPLVGFRYGYSIWKLTRVPLFMPAKFNSWGCTGVTGCYLWYHPETESYIALNFNDTSWRTKGLRFMLSSVINPLLRCRK
jgi:D-alanyl-D-alanine carboxypeptidase